MVAEDCANACDANTVSYTKMLKNLRSGDISGLYLASQIRAGGDRDGYSRLRRKRFHAPSRMAMAINGIAQGDGSSG
jgi:hypothetical protein